MAIVELRRTAVVKLDVDDDAHRLLQETIERFKQAAQMVADEGWNGTDKDYIIERDEMDCVECGDLAVWSVSEIRWSVRFRHHQGR